MEYIEEFEKLWSKYLVVIEGKLISQSQTTHLGHPQASYVLMTSRDFWDSEYGEGYRWLKKYVENEPKKGERVKAVLTKDMSFLPEPEIKSNYGAAACVASIAGSAIGLGLTSLLDGGLLMKAISVVVPPLAIYPTVNGMGKNANDKHKDELVKRYIAQLDKYKVSVLSIIES